MKVKEAPADSAQQAINVLKKKIKKPIVIFDIETTDADIYSAEVVQFGAIKVFPNGKTQELDFLCKPEKTISQGAMDVHGITNEEVSKVPPFKHFIPQLVDLFKDSDVAGFNLKRFDVKIVGRQMKDHGHAEFFKDCVVYDAYTVFCNHCSRKLSNAVQFYIGEEIRDAHDAMGDVRATMAVMAKQLERESATMNDVAAKLCADKKDKEGEKEDPLARYLTERSGKLVLNFSKHKGMPIDKVDKGFLKWVMAGDFPKPFKDIVKRYIK